MILSAVMRFALAAALTILAAVTLAPPKVGQLAPDFTLRDQNGKAVALSAARGAKVALVFYRGYW